MRCGSSRSLREARRAPTLDMHGSRMMIEPGAIHSYLPIQSGSSTTGLPKKLKMVSDSTSTVHSSMGVWKGPLVRNVNMLIAKDWC